MPDKTYVITEIVGVSENSISQAVANAISRANQTLKALDWFEVKGVRGTIADGKVGQYQVYLDVGFRYLSDEEMAAWVRS
jgi:flavin-binding protein dodecin